MYENNAVIIFINLATKVWNSDEVLMYIRYVLLSSFQMPYLCTR